MVIFFLSYCLLFNKITLNKGNVGTNHLNNRILLFVCNRKVIYYYYITLPSITITITITFGNFQSITITITITGKSGYYYYNYILHITITPSLVSNPSLYPVSVCQSLFASTKNLFLYSRMFALQRIKDAGVYLTTSESMLLGLVGDAKHPKFKGIQKLIWDEAPDSGLLTHKPDMGTPV